LGYFSHTTLAMYLGVKNDECGLEKCQLMQKNANNGFEFSESELKTAATNYVIYYPIYQAKRLTWLL